MVSIFQIVQSIQFLHNRMFLAHKLCVVSPLVLEGGVRCSQPTVVQLLHTNNHVVSNIESLNRLLMDAQLPQSRISTLSWQTRACFMPLRQ